MAFHPCLRIVVLLLLTVCIEQPGFSQEASPPETQSDSTATLPVVQEDAPVLNPYQKVDAVFKEAVSLMEMVLFYRVGRSEREYIVFERNSVYQRERGSDANFVNIVPDDPGQPAVLTDQQVQVLAAQGKLVDGQVKPYQLGTINGKPVEYVTVKLDSPDGTVKYGDKFAWKASIGEYRILQKKRNLPGELTVSQSTVDDWDRQGFLKTTSKPKEGQPAYLLSEPVGGIPIVVGWLALGGLFFTLFMRGFNFWGFRHALNIVRGKYDNPKETGEVTHFQALASALSATIGLGNIAGVTIAMTLGDRGRSSGCCCLASLECAASLQNVRLGKSIATSNRTEPFSEVPCGTSRSAWLK